ncbi:hypothetical protein [Prescottella equi]|nr:hypothetical protein [Prescottella equi]
MRTYNVISRHGIDHIDDQGQHCWCGWVGDSHAEHTLEMLDEGDQA